MDCGTRYFTSVPSGVRNEMSVTLLPSTAVALCAPMYVSCRLERGGRELPCAPNINEIRLSAT